MVRAVVLHTVEVEVVRVSSGFSRRCGSEVAPLPPVRGHGQHGRPNDAEGWPVRVRIALYTVVGPPTQ